MQDSATYVMNKGVAVATARFYDTADGIEDKFNIKLFSIRCTSLNNHERT
mgnify:CR=1 FL=1